MCISQKFFEYISKFLRCAPPHYECSLTQTFYILNRITKNIWIVTGLENNSNTLHFNEKSLQNRILNSNIICDKCFPITFSLFKYLKSLKKHAYKKSKRKVTKKTLTLLPVPLPTGGCASAACRIVHTINSISALSWRSDIATEIKNINTAMKWWQLIYANNGTIFAQYPEQ